jgi:hypothetical protein
MNYPKTRQSLDEIRNVIEVFKAGVNNWRNNLGVVGDELRALGNDEAIRQVSDLMYYIKNISDVELGSLNLLINIDAIKDSLK